MRNILKAVLALIFAGLVICDLFAIKTLNADVENELIETEARASVEAPKVEEITAPAEHNSLGEFRLTAYCPCSECSGKWGDMTATGTTATEGRTVAVDPNVIPYGTELIINGKSYIAEDCGGAINGNDIDIYFESHEEADIFGVQYAEVFLKNES